jgi:hypothetical protein
VALGAPAGLGVGFLVAGLWSPYSASSGYFDSRGLTLAPERYLLQGRAVTTTAALAGVGGGLTVTVVAAALVLCRYALRAGKARRALQERLQELAGRFPEVVQAWGGPDALAEREALERLLRAAEAPA